MPNKAHGVQLIFGGTKYVQTCFSIISPTPIELRVIVWDAEGVSGHGGIGFISVAILPGLNPRFTVL